MVAMAPRRRPPYGTLKLVRERAQRLEFFVQVGFQLGLPWERQRGECARQHRGMFPTGPVLQLLGALRRSAHASATEYRQAVAHALASVHPSSLPARLFRHIKEFVAWTHRAFETDTLREHQSLVQLLASDKCTSTLWTMRALMCRAVMRCPFDKQINIMDDAVMRIPGIANRVQEIEVDRRIYNASALHGLAIRAVPCEGASDCSSTEVDDTDAPRREATGARSRATLSCLGYLALCHQRQYMRQETVKVTTGSAKRDDGGSSLV
ncbi:MAG: hypothetical protein MHM6MM_006499 [Cercozoa sp. M6MM]